MTFEMFVFVGKLIILFVVLWAVLKLGPYPDVKLGLWIQLRIHHIGQIGERVRYFAAWLRRWWRKSGWQEFWSLE